MLDQEKKTAYIPIQPPYTVDLSRDQRDGKNAAAGVFRKLTNYITGRQTLEVRKGITEFTHI